MDVTAKYELIGLMAYPIRHSLSPEMQNKALEKAGLPFTYMAFEVDNDSFPGAIEGLKVMRRAINKGEKRDKCLCCCVTNREKELQKQSEVTRRDEPNYRISFVLAQI